MVSAVFVLVRCCVAMLRRHRVAHGVLAGIYAAMFVILAAEAAYAHAVCAAVAAVVYGALCQPPGGPVDGADVGDARAHGK